MASAFLGFSARASSHIFMPLASAVAFPAQPAKNEVLTLSAQRWVWAASVMAPAINKGNSLIRMVVPFGFHVKPTAPQCRGLTDEPSNFPMNRLSPPTAGQQNRECSDRGPDR